jgi:UDP-3-O-[3-hydroxymyristoyl] N-acetylglucosamine deacetylase
MGELMTIGRRIELSGVGVHSGRAVRLSLVPSGSGGVVFRRIDLGGAEMRLLLESIESRNSTTLVGAAFRVQTVEHLLAALFAFGVGSLVVELDAGEVPIMDGSAAPFAEALAAAGTRPLVETVEPFVIRAPLSVREGGAEVVFEPPDPGDPGLDLSYTIIYDHPAIGIQTRSVRLTSGTFAREIAPARTFGFLKDADALRRQGLALGSSLENTVVLDDDGVVSGPLRFSDEFVRHKLLDLAGDLALAGRPILGRVTARKAGHRLHLAAVKRLLVPES